MENVKIVWSKQSKESLKSIYQYYKEKSLEAAKTVKNEILQGPKTIYFSKQYQVDDINPKYRRILVRDYKILYRQSGDTIYIIDIFSCKRSPNDLRRL
jgi:plasmid stabilization system protein ParE